MKKYAIGFSRWLFKQKDRRDAVGDLAYDAYDDEGWPHRARSFREFLSYLQAESTGQNAEEALEIAWHEYSGCLVEMGHIEEIMGKLDAGELTTLEHGDTFEPKPKAIYIYALTDPTDYDTIRYIGVTKDPAKRLRDHAINPGSVEKLLWTANILRSGKYPAMIILDSTASREMASALEKTFISEFTWPNQPDEFKLFNRNLTDD